MTPPTDTATFPFGALATRLQLLRTEAGQPSFATISKRIAQARRARGVPEHEVAVSRTTVYDCFRTDRKRVDTDLVLEIVRALSQDPAVVAGWAADLRGFQRRIAAAAMVTVSDRLPSPLPDFIGRTSELATLASGGSAWICGLPGSGKSQLAFQAARELVAAGEVAGTLLADLRGFSPEGPPADPQAVVNGLLRLLGNSDRAITAAGRVTVLNEEIRSRNLLVIVDDAASADQVSAIFPDLHRVRAIITSRIVPDLTAGPPALMRLPPFSRAESVAAISAIAGESATADPDTTNALLDTTGDLPLAVQLTASRVAAHPEWTMAEHAEYAAGRQRSLRLPDALQQAFTLTYLDLPPPAQDLLRLIAVHPEALLDRTSLLALAGDVIPTPEAAIDQLQRANLLTQPHPRRYAIHELPRVHAADMSIEVDPPSRRTAARNRLIESLVARTWAAQAALKKAVSEVPWPPRLVPNPALLAQLTLTADAAAEFFHHSADLLLGLAVNRDLADDPHSVAMLYAASESLMAHLHQAGRFDDSLILHREALRHAQHTGDELGQVRALACLGATYVQVGQHEEAGAALTSAIAMAGAYPVERLTIHNSLGVALAFTGRDDEAETHYRAALHLAEELNDLRRLGFAWSNLANLFMRRGEQDAARAALERAIEHATRTNDAASIARNNINLASLLIELDDAPAALEAARAGYDQAHAIGMNPGIVVSTTNLSGALIKLDRHEEAISWIELGMELAEQTGMIQHHVTLTGNLSICLRLRGELARAGKWAFTSLTGCIPVGDDQLTQWALDRLVECLGDTSAIDSAHPQWGAVAELVAAHDSAEARQVQAALFS